MQPFTLTYQFFPLLVTEASGCFILSLHHSITSSVSKERFFLIRTAPKSVVCNLSRFESNSLVVYIKKISLFSLKIMRSRIKMIKRREAAGRAGSDNCVCPSLFAESQAVTEHDAEAIRMFLICHILLVHLISSVQF